MFYGSTENVQSMKIAWFQIQFVIIIAHASQLYIYDCSYPRIMISILGVNTLFILVLFTLFYINSYVKNKRE